MTAGGNMLSAIVEKSGAPRVGVICLGSVRLVTRSLINISHQLIRSIAYHFPTGGDEPWWMQCGTVTRSTEGHTDNITESVCCVRVYKDNSTVVSSSFYLWRNHFLDIFSLFSVRTLNMNLETRASFSSTETVSRETASSDHRGKKITLWHL